VHFTLTASTSAYSGLEIFWFIVIAILWSMYFVLEGFDFGVGMLLPILGRDDLDRRVLINTIGPVWDGNEVWLLTAGGATFAAFPNWYATLFSGFYLPLFLILAALIFRGVAFEFRAKRAFPAWQAAWDQAIFWGSLIPALLWGVAFANILRGVPIGAHESYLGSFFNLLNPYALVGGITTLLLFALHGAVFLSLKTTDEMHERASRAAKMLAPAATAALTAFLAWTYVNAHHMHTTPDWSHRSSRCWPSPQLPRWAGCYGRGLRAGPSWPLRSPLWELVATIFLNLFPRVMVSSISKTYDLTIGNAASAPYTLKVMTIVLSSSPLWCSCIRDGRTGSSGPGCADLILHVKTATGKMLPNHR
jgi:cytochrome d ubiquinol oxidase subunit II